MIQTVAFPSAQGKGIRSFMGKFKQNIWVGWHLLRWGLSLSIDVREGSENMHRIDVRLLDN